MATISFPSPASLGQARAGERPAAPSARAAGWGAVGLVALGWLLLSIDLGVGRWAAAGGCPRRVHEMLHVTEIFGNGWGIALVLAGVWVLDPAKRRGVIPLALGGLGAGMAANLFKVLMARVRPRSLPHQTIDVFQTFWGWIPPSHERSTFHSFPSAHTASAVALAVLMATLYPRGRWYFGLLALCVALQRVEIAAHFPSDVAWGAALGWGVGQLLARGRWVGRLATDGLPNEAAPSLSPRRQAA